MTTETGIWVPHQTPYAATLDAAAAAWEAVVLATDPEGKAALVAELARRLTDCGCADLLEILLARAAALAKKRRCPA
jgi:hypothetical protein